MCKDVPPPVTYAVSASKTVGLNSVQILTSNPRRRSLIIRATNSGGATIGMAPVSSGGTGIYLGQNAIPTVLDRDEFGTAVTGEWYAVADNIGTVAWTEVVDVAHGN